MKNEKELIFDNSGFVLSIGERSFKVNELSPSSFKFDSSVFFKFLNSSIDTSNAILINGRIDQFINCDKDAVKYTPSIAHSITNCIVFKAENIKEYFQLSDSAKYLITTKAVGNYLCKKNGIELPSKFVSIAYEANGYSDFSRFENLWKNYDFTEFNLNTFEVDELPFIIVSNKLGKILGYLHGRNMLHTDAHLGNFLVDEELEVKAIDPDSFEFYLRPLTAKECASDFLLLLPYQSKRSWAALKTGYIEELGDLALFTLNLIEKGDEFMYFVYFNQGKFSVAITHLFNELSKNIEASKKRYYYSQIGVCYSKLKMLDKAILFYNKSLTPQEKKTINNDNVSTHFNIGVAYQKQNKLKIALSNFKEIKDASFFHEPNNWKIRLSTFQKLAEVYIEQKNFKKGKIYLKRFISLGKQNNANLDYKLLEKDLKHLNNS